MRGNQSQGVPMVKRMTSTMTDFIFSLSEVCMLIVKNVGRLGGSVVEHLPLAQGMILESWDRVPHWAPCVQPASPSACVSASVCVCVSHEK